MARSRQQDHQDGHRLVSREILTDYICAARGDDCGVIDLDIAIERFTYGVGEDATVLSCQVVVFTCTTCGMAWTDHTAEAAREQAVQRHLESKRKGAG